MTNKITQHLPLLSQFSALSLVSVCLYEYSDVCLPFSPSVSLSYFCEPCVSGFNIYLSAAFSLSIIFLVSCLTSELRFALAEAKGKEETYLQESRTVCAGIQSPGK